VQWIDLDRLILLKIERPVARPALTVAQRYDHAFQPVPMPRARLVFQPSHLGRTSRASQALGATWSARRRCQQVRPRARRRARVGQSADAGPCISATRRLTRPLRRRGNASWPSPRRPAFGRADEARPLDPWQLSGRDYRPPGEAELGTSAHFACENTVSYGLPVRGATAATPNDSGLSQANLEARVPLPLLAWMN